MEAHNDPFGQQSLPLMLQARLFSERIPYLHFSRCRLHIMDTEEGAALLDAPKVHGCCPLVSFFCREIKDRADEPLAANAEKPWIRVCLCEFIQAGEYLHILLAGLSKADARIKDDSLFFHTGAIAMESVRSKKDFIEEMISPSYTVSFWLCIRMAGTP